MWDGEADSSMIVNTIPRSWSWMVGLVLCSLLTSLVTSLEISTPQPGPKLNVSVDSAQIQRIFPAGADTHHHHEHGHQHGEDHGHGHGHGPFSGHEDDIKNDTEVLVGPGHRRDGQTWLLASVAVMVISLCGVFGVIIIPFMQRIFYQHLLQFLIALGKYC